MSGQRVVLVGAGHAHAHLAKRASEFVQRGMTVTLISPGPFYYSGLATGVLCGRHAHERNAVDLGRLVAQAGGEFIRGLVTRIDPPARSVWVDGGRQVPYDVLSLDIGSEVPSGRIPGANQHALTVKPIDNITRLRRSLEARPAGSAVRLVVVGGGPSACELTANLVTLAKSRRLLASITLLCAGRRLLAALPERAASVVARCLTGRGVNVRTNTRAVRAEAGRVETHTGDPVAFDVLLLATGLVPPPWLREVGLPVAADGSLVVDECLRSTGDDRVFGGGDCVAFRGQPLPRVGVYAVRQGPVLLHNLLATLEGRPLRAFVPQRHYLWVMNLGDGTAMAARGDWWYRGRAALWLKDWLDLSFVDNFR